MARYFKISRRRHPARPKDLSTESLWVIGLCNAGIYSEHRHLEICAIGTKYDRCRAEDAAPRRLAFVEFSAELQTSEVEVVQAMLLHGVPRHLARPLYRGASWRCPKCNCKSFYSPCLMCCPAEEDEILDDDADDFYGTAATPEPTIHLPGSPDKMEVMRGRVSRGEELFSPDDAIGIYNGPRRE